ncbi:MAG: Stk1 family PASTA domain-containing Ser/Thr kinase [Oscillospiraceae bacterium]|nr:Stk1 family PASTA domain-containing Ser/Thr kinase [Oscillospiraceae bacterium]
MDTDKYIGRLLDNRYEIKEVIGIGGMAVVYKARCHRLNRLVAIKILKDDYSRDEDFRRRFHAESQAVAMLSHPNIVSVYDVSSGEADYIVMELIDGISLKQYMEMKGILNWKETLHFGMQIAKALEHAHSRGIVHRDIKPHNVMVLKNGSVKVTDFGIARIMSKGNTLTKEALGSVHYISPEQAKGGRVDNRSDIYSLGVVMYEMMTGRPPYDGESPVSVAIQHINGGAAAPSTLNPNIPKGLEQIIMKGMGHEPADRYETATAMLYDMEKFRQDPAFIFPYMIAGAGIPSTDTMPLGTGTAAAAAAASQRPSGASAAAQQAGVSPQPGASGRTASGRGTSGNNTGRTSSSGSRAGQAGMSSVAAAQARRAAAARRRAEEKEERNNRIAMIAVIVCTVGLFLAIAIILGVLLTGDKKPANDPATTGVYVQSYVGQYWDVVENELPKDIIVTEKLVYHDSVEAGKVIEQDPAGGSALAPGSSVTFTISMGKEPLEKTMETLTGVELSTAESFLNNLGLKFNLLPIQEYSDTVEAGCVTRTDPLPGQPLTDGQTIKIWYSKGPETVKAKVPNVVGRQVDVALRVLEGSGFKSVILEPVESNEDKDEVVWMSVTSGELIDVNTQIILQVSNGPTTPPPTTPPPATTTPAPTTTPAETTPAPTTTASNTRQLTFILDPEREGDVTARIVCNETGVEIYNQTVSVEQGMIYVNVTGTGTRTYTLYINGVEYDTETVTF